MKFLQKSKDGGPESTVTAYWLIEIKWLFSIALLRFDHGTRDEYHTHAFNSLNWVLKGHVTEEDCVTDFGRQLDALNGHPPRSRSYFPSLRPILTLRQTFHRVRSFGKTWVFTVRGPWKKLWAEYDPSAKVYTLLSQGRKVVTSFDSESLV